MSKGVIGYFFYSWILKFSGYAVSLPGDAAFLSGYEPSMFSRVCFALLNASAAAEDELEKRLQTDERVTLLAIGRIRYKLLAYLQKRRDIEIVKVETRYMKNRDKGIGLKVTVTRLDKHKSTS